MSARPTRRSLGHSPKGQRGILVAVSGERGEARRNHRRLVDRRVVDLLQVPQQPAGGHAWVPARFFPRDQRRQLERVGEVSGGSSFAAPSATGRLPRWIARRKIE